ncbi:AfsR/SARP family transcriptional regulator [Allosalinactinospora lopnorensis]|uniref:AfsR/SARP family transcriptional regulator n=1 Tax=Allosalinactinospora lopnorensis TaxID=1352348 RepID=UPI001F2E7FF2|nr:bacterial transcriptional activator domain-containing protein [Allosalinactinospora lopnorensis]
MHPESSALLPEDEAAETRAPYPGLATIGHDADGAQILVELPQTGAIGLYGPAEDTKQVLAALALELATSVSTDHLNLSCIGVADGLASTAKTGRIRAADSVHQCLRELELLTLEYASGESSTEDIPPEVVLSAYPLTSEHLGRMRTIVGHAAAPPIAIIAAATEEHPLPGTWRLDTAKEARQKLPILDQPVTLQRLTDDEYTKLADLLRHAEETRSVAAPGWEKVPTEDTLEPVPVGSNPLGQRTDTSTTQTEALSTLVSIAKTTTPPPQPTAPAIPQDTPPRLETYEVQLCVLGPVELIGPDPASLEAGKRRVLTELACLLRLRPERTPDQISRSMGGPRGPWSAKYRADNLSKLRVWLGRAQGGKLHLPTMSGGTYSLSPTVGCDWACFQQLAQHGLASEDAAGTALLEQALTLVHGEPLSGTPLDRYAWAEPLKPTMLAAIVDTAHTIAARHLRYDYGNLDTAREALLKVLEIDPVCELLYRDLIRVEHRAGNPEGITRAAQRLYIALNKLDLEMTPQTEELLRKHGVR